jgi:hypothetical protein
VVTLPPFLWMGLIDKDGKERCFKGLIHRLHNGKLNYVGNIVNDLISTPLFKALS